MSYYNNYRGQRSSTYNNTSPSAAPPKRLLPDQLHNVFRIELHRLNNKRELCATDALLFDSDIEQQSSTPFSPTSSSSTSTPSGGSSVSDTASSRKYALAPVFIGEIWRFRLKLSNKLKEALHNFGLLCHIEQNEKGNGGTPLQLYPRPRELCPTQLATQDNMCLDLEYPVTSNQPTSYSLMLTITASNQDESQQLYKDVFEFHAVPCLSLTYQKQTLEENLFVEALVHNVSNQPSVALAVHVNFKCMELFKAYNLTQHNAARAITPTATTHSDHNNDDGTPGRMELAPAQDKNVLFQIEMKNPTSLVNLNALSVGKIEVRWRTPQAPFREGMFLSDIIQRRSLFCRKLDTSSAAADGGGSGGDKSSHAGHNIEILILKCPSSSMVHCAFTVTFHIFNLDRCAREIWLRIDKNTSGYLLPCHLSRRYLGVVDTSSSIKTDMTLIALVPGIHVLTGIVIETRAVPKFGARNASPIKSVHYESSQYIYIDIDERFHARKMKERREKERVFLQQKQAENEGEGEGELEQVQLSQTETDGHDEKEKESTQVTLTATAEIETDTNTNEADADGDVAMLPMAQPRESMSMSMENESSDMLRPSPTHKPAIPQSSAMTPIGHQKSAAEIEHEQARIASAAAAVAAANAVDDDGGDNVAEKPTVVVREDAMEYEHENEEQEHNEEAETETAVDEEIHSAAEDVDVDGEEKVIDDDMDIAPLEIAMQNATLATADEDDEQVQVQDNEEETEEQETQGLTSRHLAAKDPANQSTMSMNTVNGDSNADERTDDEKEAKADGDASQQEHVDGDQEEEEENMQ